MGWAVATSTRARSTLPAWRTTATSTTLPSLPAHSATNCAARPRKPIAFTTLFIDEYLHAFRCVQWLVHSIDKNLKVLHRTSSGQPDLTHTLTYTRMNDTVLSCARYALCYVIYIYMIGLTTRTARTQPKRPACHRPHATNTAPCFTAHRSSWAESTRTCASADTPTVQTFLQCSFIFTGLFLRQQAVVLLCGVAGG